MSLSKKNPGIYIL